jgi:hypothetical protein
MILFDKGAVVNEPAWENLHSSFVRSIQAIQNPVGSGAFTLRERIPIPRPSNRGQQKFHRNGVVSIKERFYHHLTQVEGWLPETGLDFGIGREDLMVPLTLYPSGEDYREPLGANFGSFDFATTAGGIKTVIEWETGNISSSHRSINKLCVCLNAGIVQAGVVIVPSRPLYKHLTDRIGNIDELSGYLSLWQSVEARVERGLLAIAVVEHDHLTTDNSFPLLDRGADGRAAEGRRNLET